MWIFSVLGFYSIACAQNKDGSPDTSRVMIRGRRREHLENLRKQFPVLADEEIITLKNRDYRYRIVARKSDWVGVLAELAQEQEWSNFKNQVAKEGKGGTAYTAALHDVWEVMHGLQGE